MSLVTQTLKFISNVNTSYITPTKYYHSSKKISLKKTPMYKILDYTDKKIIIAKNLWEITISCFSQLKLTISSAILRYHPILGSVFVRGFMYRIQMTM